jgi:hypothetical protein
MNKLKTHFEAELQKKLVTVPLIANAISLPSFVPRTIMQVSVVNNNKTENEKNFSFSWAYPRIGASTNMRHSIGIKFYKNYFI